MLIHRFKIVIKLDENNYQEIELKKTQGSHPEFPVEMQLTTKGFSNLTLRLKLVPYSKDGVTFDGSVTGRSYFLGTVNVGVKMVLNWGLNSLYGMRAELRNGRDSYKVKAEATIENR